MHDDVISGTAAKKADLIAMGELGLDSLTLMETASRTVADYIEQRHSRTDVRVISLCGVGNNGADGICIARLLKEAGYRTGALIVGDLRKASWEFLHQLAMYKRWGGEVSFYSAGEAVALPGDPLAIAEKGDEDTVLVDALFGIGLKREIGGDYRSCMAETGSRHFLETVAVDAPSGINTDTGEIMGIALHADTTITFGRNKTGLVCGDGSSYAGNVIVMDIGIPDEAYRKAVL